MQAIKIGGTLAITSVGLNLVAVGVRYESVTAWAIVFGVAMVLLGVSLVFLCVAMREVG